ncbi:Ldh family oxidoreductase [Gudongella sp. DL1XJH-153]|uniref:Ldh family oxidoreductase n=1 Tax=Gudongella sp. DL1XJH-153 TaxID=3409804 RepID=UPI003BB6092A
MSNETVLIDNQVLKLYCKKLFINAGVPEDDAEIASDNLVDANLHGVDSHGVSRMGIYLKRIREGVDKPVCNLDIENELPATASINANASIGSPVGYRAMKMAIEKARETGIAFVTVKGSNHIGTAAYYSRLAIENDMIGFSATNGAARMAPWGGKEALLGTNPFAVGIPAGKERPIVADMATSLVARGKIILAAKNDQEIPLGWAIDKNGKPTTNAQEGLDGTVLPFGGPKGYGIALLIDILCGILSGSSFGKHINDMYADFENPTNIGNVFGVINIEKFVPIEYFKSNIDQLIQEVKSSPKADGISEIYLPGEIEALKKEDRLENGIPVTRAVLEELREEGEKLGVEYTLEKI